MTWVTYNIYFSRNGEPVKVAELGVPFEGCWWSGTFIEGPVWPEVVWSEDGNGYAYRADLDEEPTEEEDTEWDRIMEEARYDAWRDAWKESEREIKEKVKKSL